MTRASIPGTHRRQMAFILCMGLLGIPVMTHAGFCQSDLPKYEAGAQYVFMYHPDFNQTASGVGGRFTCNVTPFFAVESEIDFLPQKQPVLNSSNSPFLRYEDSRRIEGLFGVKAGIRRHRFGLFGKARPGFFYISEGKRYIDPNIVFIRAPEEARSQFKFAMDIGVVFEAYVSNRAFIRIDAGDTMIKFARSELGDLGVRDFLSHNLQLNAGFGFRF